MSKNFLIPDGFMFNTLFEFYLEKINNNEKDNDIFKVPRIEEYRYAGLERCIQFLSNDGILYIVGALVTIWETEPVEDDTTTPDVDESADGVLKTFEGNYYGKYWPVLIDINGIGGKNNNALGYERFLVYVDSFGKVIPAGGEEAVLYGAETTVRAACTPEDVDERCIATVIKNAWEVTY